VSLPAALRRVASGGDLDAALMDAAMREIMTGQAAPEQVAGLLTGLAVKGETVAELAAAARVMREFATTIEVAGPHLVDTCGTGGDGAGIFNVSTACAFVAAAAGARVAKHGNRSVSSTSGSADVLERAGLNLELEPAAVAQAIERIGVGFLFAQQHHPAARHVAPVRRKLGVRTLFNLLGPLSNPAAAPHQVLGVYERRWLEPVAETLAALGSRHVLVVHASDGLDEISLAAETEVAELLDGSIATYTITPEEFGIRRRPLDSLRVSDADRSLRMIRGVLEGAAGAAADLVALNAGAAIYAADLVDDLAQAVEQAHEILASGAAAERMDQLIAFSSEAR